MKVLIAIEDDVFAEAIVDFVSKHDWPKSTVFEVLHVLDFETTDEIVSEIYTDISAEVRKERSGRAQKLVQDTEERLKSAINSKYPVSTKIEYGNPKDVIVDEAERGKFDLLLLGSHGRTGFKRFLLGSVSMSVLSAAPCSILIVKLQKPAAHRAVGQRQEEYKVESKV